MRATTAAAAVVASGALLAVVDSRLSRLQPQPGTFTSRAFTGPQWPPLNTTPLAGAIEAWTADHATAPVAGRWVVVHSAIDLAVFTPAYLLAARHLLRWATRPTGQDQPWATAALQLPNALLAVEMAEGLATLAVLRPLSWDGRVEPDRRLGIVTMLSSIKFSLLGAILLAVGVFGLRRGPRLRAT